MLAAGLSPGKDKSDSNLLNEVRPDDSAFDGSGQRELDSDEMNEEMMDEYTPANPVQAGWKISDSVDPDPTPRASDVSTDPSAQGRAAWG